MESEASLDLADSDPRQGAWPAAAPGERRAASSGGTSPRRSLPTPQAQDSTGGDRSQGPGAARRSCPPAPYSGSGAMASLAGWLAEPGSAPGVRPVPSRDLIRAAARELVSAAHGDDGPLPGPLHQQQTEQAACQTEQVEFGEPARGSESGACRYGAVAGALPPQLVRAEGDTGGAHS